MNLNEIVITDIAEVFTVFSKKGDVITMTDRKHYGLSLTLDGQITYTQNGVSYIQDKNHAVILPKGQSYTISGDAYGEFPVINFETESFLADTITILPVENIDFIYGEFQQMKNLSFSSERRLSVMSIFYNILDSLSRYSPSESSILDPAVRYIEKNYCQDITNSHLADECKISEEYFRKLFKKIYGVSPKSYVTNFRLSKAKQFLKEGNLKIGTISELCGFSNQYHFCRFFKKKIGLTPTEYSKKNKISKI